MTRRELLKLHDTICRRAKAIMVRKNHDYGENDDPFKNFRAHGMFGIMVRKADKMARMQTYLDKGRLLVKDEGVMDSAIDDLNYDILFIGMLMDTLKRGKGDRTHGLTKLGTIGYFDGDGAGKEKARAVPRKQGRGAVRSANRGRSGRSYKGRTRPHASE